jgi:hypothetical protein
MTIDKEKSREVQAQLNRFLQAHPEDSRTREDPIQPCSDLPGSSGSDFHGLVHAQSKGERIISKTIRFSTFRELWRKLTGKGGDFK